MTEQERERRWTEFSQLLERAGISGEIERCNELLWDDYWEDRGLPPEGSTARKEAEERLYEGKFDYYRHRLRKTIFGVDDPETRKQIIHIYRQRYQEKVERLRHDLWNANRKLITAERVYNPVVKAIAGALLIAIGWAVSHWVGAVVVGIATVIFAIYDSRSGGQFGLREVTGNVAEAQSALDEAAAREIFVDFEESTGEPVESPK
jgi:hypothetical protein